MLADPVLQRVSELPQLNGAVAQFILEPRIKRDHDVLPWPGRASCPTIQYEKCTQSSRQSASAAALFYETLTCRLRPSAFWRTRQLPPRTRLDNHPSSHGNRTRLTGIGPARQIACCTHSRLVCHCAAMTSPCLMAPARTACAFRDYPFGPHEMATWAAQGRRSGPAGRREPHQFTARRHKATVGAIPACDINKSNGLAEKSSARCEVVDGADLPKQTEHSNVSRAEASSKC